MQKNLNSILKQISAIIPNYCDKCGSKYGKADFEIIRQDLSGISCRLDCKSCNNSYMMQVTHPGDGMLAAKRASVHSDLSSEEIRKFSEIDNLDRDEILDVHIALQEVKDINDLRSLL